MRSRNTSAGGFLVIKASANLPAIARSVLKTSLGKVRLMYSFSAQQPGGGVGVITDGGGSSNSPKTTASLLVRKPGTYSFWVHATVWDNVKPVSQIGKLEVVSCQVQ